MLEVLQADPCGLLFELLRDDEEMELVEVKLVVEKPVLGRELSNHNPFFEGRQERIPSR